jgi:hypothetical protein
MWACYVIEVTYVRTVVTDKYSDVKCLLCTAWRHIGE